MASPKKASRDAGRRAAGKVNALAELESRDRCRSRPRPRAPAAEVSVGSALPQDLRAQPLTRDLVSGRRAL
jgi:hypothetical protein